MRFIFENCDACETSCRDHPLRLRRSPSSSLSNPELHGCVLGRGRLDPTAVLDDEAFEPLLLTDGGRFAPIPFVVTGDNRLVDECMRLANGMACAFTPVGSTASTPLSDPVSSRSSYPPSDASPNMSNVISSQGDLVSETTRFICGSATTSSPKNVNGELFWSIAISKFTPIGDCEDASVVTITRGGRVVGWK